MKIPQLIIITLLLTSCNDEPVKNVSKAKEEIKTISILLSGRGREIPVDQIPKDSIIPNKFLSDMYLIELNDKGKLKVTHGFGEMSFVESSGRKDLQMNSIESNDSIIITKSKLNEIFSLAQKVYQDDAYRTDRSPTDSWLAKLKINNKTYVYFIGENTLDISYLKLADKIAELSPIEIREYRH